MLVLKRKEGQWVDITHRSGDVLRIRVCRIEPQDDGRGGQLNLAFDDDLRYFEIERPERKAKRDAMAAEVAHAMDAEAEAERVEVGGVGDGREAGRDELAAVQGRGFGLGLAVD